MSFILDALKKSELERQRQAMPGMVDAGPVPRRPGLPRWAVALGLLLGINLVVLLVVLLHNGTSSPATATPAAAAVFPAQAKAAAPAPAPAAPPAAADHFSPLDAPPTATSTPAAGRPADAPVYAPEIPVDAAAEPAAAHQQPTEQGVKAAPAHRDPLLSDADGTDDDEVLPSMSELNLTGPQGLPDMHIDVHVYATRPSERFVYINMRKYHEGATLQEGPVLERIRRDGAVLNYHGLRFILPRQ